MAAPEYVADPFAHGYLRIDQATTTGHLHELRGGTYVEVAAGPTIELVEPFVVRLDLPGLLP